MTQPSSFGNAAVRARNKALAIFAGKLTGKTRNATITSIRYPEDVCTEKDMIVVEVGTPPKRTITFYGEDAAHINRWLLSRRDLPGFLFCKVDSLPSSGGTPRPDQAMQPSSLSSCISNGRRDIEGRPPSPKKNNGGRRRSKDRNPQFFDPASAIVVERDFRPPPQTEDTDAKFGFACAALTGIMANASIGNAKLNYDQIAECVLTAAEAMARKWSERERT